MPINKNKLGFTIIELMVVVALLSIMSGIMLSAFVAMMQQSQTVNSKIKMRNDARLGMDYMMANLRMAKFNRDTDNVDDMVIMYEDTDGNVGVWPPPELAGTEFSEPVNSITFVRPIDADNNGSPFEGDTPNINWSVPITFQLDEDDANGDGRTDQIVQLNDGDFARVVVGDISPVVNSGNGSIYDTPATGGLAFQGEAADGDTTKVYVTLIQRRDVGARNDAIVMRYDSFVDIQN